MYKSEDLSDFSNESVESYSRKGMSIQTRKSGYVPKFPKSLPRPKPDDLDYPGFLQVNMIHDLDSLNEARSLLYHCYIEKMKWDIQQNNCSGIHVDIIKQKFCLVDDYDQIAIWFSVKQQGKIVACARLCPEDLNGKLELERYPEAQRILGFTVEKLKREFRVIELNREAILPHYAAGNSARILLFKKIFEYCILNRYAIITATHIQDWTRFYNHILFTELKGLQFKYSAADLEKVTVYFASQKNIQEMNNKLNFITNEMEVEKC